MGKLGKLGSSKEYKHASIAVIITMLIVFRLDGFGLREELYQTFGFFILYLVILVVTSGLAGGE